MEKFKKGQKGILLLGGARSGKSRYALNLAKKMGRRVLFVATGQALDEEMALRIEEHKKNRPQEWQTLEIATGIDREIRQKIGSAEVVIVDCLTLLVSNLLNEEALNYQEAEEKVMNEIKELVESLRKLNVHFIIVSNEVGMGLVPQNKLGRFYRDLLGKANQFVAEKADQVYFLVSSIPIKIK